MTSYGNSGEGIHDVVLPRRRQDQGFLFPAGMAPERAAVGADGQIRGAYVVVLVKAEPGHGDSHLLRHSPHAGQVPVQDGETVSGQILKDLTLRPGNVVQAAQLAQMGSADVRDDGHVGAGDGAHGLDLAQGPHPHFDDGDFRVGTDLQQCPGQADFVVEIRFCLDHAVLGAQDRGNHVFRRRFAVGTRNGDDLQVREAQTPGPGDILVGRQRIGHLEDDRAVGHLHRSGNDDTPGAGGDSLPRVDVTVKAFPLQGYEKFSRPDRAGIRIDACKFRYLLRTGSPGADLGARRGHDLPYGNHTRVPFQYVSTSSLSLKWMVLSFKIW